MLLNGHVDGYKIVAVDTHAPEPVGARDVEAHAAAVVHDFIDRDRPSVGHPVHKVAVFESQAEHVYECCTHDLQLSTAGMKNK
jgi:hypothetical protein